MSRKHVRTMFVVFMVAVFATGASVEGLNMEDASNNPTPSEAGTAAATSTAAAVPNAAHSTDEHDEHDEDNKTEHEEDDHGGDQTASPSSAEDEHASEEDEHKSDDDEHSSEDGHDQPAMPDANTGLDALKQQNEEALQNIEALKHQMSLHTGKLQAAEELEEKKQTKEMERDQAESDIQKQKGYLDKVKEKMATADQATQIMQQMMDISQQSQAKERDLREKLSKATSQEAVEGAGDAEAAQAEVVDKATKHVTDLQTKVKTLKACTNCEDKDKHLAELQEKLSNADKDLEKQQANTKTIEVSAKNSVKEAAAARIKTMEAEMTTAKKKLETLEQQAIEADKEVASVGLGPVKLEDSKQTEIAEAAVTQEAKVANEKEVKTTKRFDEARDELVHLMERRTKKSDEAAEKKAASASEAKSSKSTGKIKETVASLQSKLAAQKKSVEVDAKKLKATALKAAAQGDLVKLAAAQAQTSKALSALRKTQQDIANSKAALSDQIQTSVFDLMHAKAEANRKVEEEMRAAKKMAETHTTPQLEQMQADGEAKEREVVEAIAKTHASLKTAIGNAAKLLGKAVQVASEATGEATKKQQEEAAKKEEATLREKAAGVVSPSEAKAMAVKMDKVKEELVDADQAVSKANAKAKRIESTVSDIAKQASVPSNDIVAVTQKMVTQLGKRMGEISLEVSQNTEMPEATTEKLNEELSNLKSSRTALQHGIESVNAKEAHESEAKKAQKDAKLALSFRSAIEKVEKMLEKRKENAQKVAATQRLMTQIDQKMAAETSAQWKKHMNEKLAGPSVSELEKQKSEISSKIQFAKKKDKEEEEAVDKIEEANVELDSAKAADKKLKEELREVQAQVDKLPKGDSAHKTELLEKVEHLSKEELASAAKVEEAAKKEKTADGISPQIESAKMSIDKFESKLGDLRGEQARLKALLGQKEVAMKNSKDDPAALKQATDAVILAKEKINENKQAAMKEEHKLSEARTQKATLDRLAKRAEDAVSREREEKVDAKNSWVKDMVQYAQKEKGMKKFGAEEEEKHLKALTKKNAEKELGHKKKAHVLTEKSEKVEETKNKQAKREADREKEKAAKAKEKEDKKEVDGKEKTNKEGIAGELKNKRAAEIKFKEDEKLERQNKGEAASKSEEAESKLVQKLGESFAVAKENKAKKAQEFQNAKEKEVNGRVTSEVVKKQAIKKIDDAIAAAAGQANEGQMKADRNQKVQAAEANEEQAKERLTKAKEAARDADAAAQKEFVTGKELKDKADKKESAAKAEENAIAEEVDTKGKIEKGNKESATKANESASKKEEQIKVDKEAAVKASNKVKAVFKAAHDKLKRAQEIYLDTKNRYDENKQKYEKFEKERAATAQRNAIKELEKAKSEMAKDERLFQGSRTKEEEREFGAQLRNDQKILKTKRITADRDAHLVESEKKTKKTNSEEEIAAQNALMRAETAFSSTMKNKEKAEKRKHSFDLAVDRLNKEKVEAESEKEKAQKAADIAKDGTSRATNEASFKEARSAEAQAKRTLQEVTQKTLETTEAAEEEGKKNEQSAKESLVKEKTAKFDHQKSDQAMRAAVADVKSEMGRKQAQRENAASERHLALKQTMDLHMEEFKAHAEKAMKNIQQSATEKGFKKKLGEEKEEKKEVEAAKAESEQVEKGGANEMDRKKDDKDLFVQVMEKDAKVRHLATIADEASNKAGDAEQERMRVFKAEREAEEMTSKAKERETKATRAIPGNAQNSNQTKTGENPAPTPKPTSTVTETKTAKKTGSKGTDSKTLDPDENPSVKPAQNFTSVYDKLAQEEAQDTMRRRRSWHRRRRWVARRRAPGTEDEDAQGGKTGKYVKGASKPGFSASFWSKVLEVKNVGEAIIKVSNKPADIKEIVDSIAYDATEGYWIGLDDRFKDNFFARFRGHINVPVNGTYTFFTKSDDGSILYVNGNKVVNNDGLKKEMAESKGDIKLESGVADVVVDFFAEQGKAGLYVEWKGPGMDRQKLSDEYVLAPKHMSIRKSLMKDELKTEISAEEAYAQMSQETHETEEVADLGQSSVTTLFY